MDEWTERLWKDVAKDGVTRQERTFLSLSWQSLHTQQITRCNDFRRCTSLRPVANIHRWNMHVTISSISTQDCRNDLCETCEKGPHPTLSTGCYVNTTSRAATETPRCRQCHPPSLGWKPVNRTPTDFLPPKPRGHSSLPALGLPSVIIIPITNMVDIFLLNIFWTVVTVKRDNLQIRDTRLA